jgi:hypothetical protein
MALLTTLNFTNQDINLVQLKELILASDSIELDFLHLDGNTVYVYGNNITDTTSFNNVIDSYTYVSKEEYLEGETLDSINELIITVPGKTVLSTSVDYSKVTNIWIATQIKPIELVPIGTIDVDKVSSLSKQLIDDNFNSLCYNNKVRSTTNLNFVGIDLGSSKLVNYIYLYWYSSNFMGDFKVQSSNDGITWADVTSTITGEWQGNNKEPQVVILNNITTRYLRLVVLNGLNSTYFVINEMKLYQDDPSIEYSLIGTLNNKKITSKLENDTLSINNKYPYDIQAKINYI